MSPASSYEFQLNPNESTTSRIPKLIEGGSNWILYKEQFRAAVYAKGLVRFLEGCDKAPVPTTALGIDPDADEHYESANDVWVAKHQSIRTILFQTLPESLKLRITSLQKASEAWQVIVDEYDNQGEFVQVELLRQMHALRCAEDSDPRPTLNQLEKVRSEYATAGASRQNLPTLTRLLDSGASRHFDPCRENFITFRDIMPKPITSADGRTFHATGEGDVRVTTIHNGKPTQFVLRDVLYAPTMPNALISISRAANTGLSVHFERDGCHVVAADGQTLFIVAEKNGLYPLVHPPPTSPSGGATALAAITPLTLSELHRRMGHAYAPALHAMAKNNVVTGLKLEDTAIPFCETCAKAKQV
ncbi:hypothetical protein IEO21_10510 [Rhodonia placenta]|uniref:GAG-pre-integrase domain-containing protein n=1 Tax=Rhodonia placenta TaxID=104341 RepID=A0A8H7TWQ9_9APHY|nr:hypothetical protein IEO21_10510 [Postia placenta]